MQYSERMKNPLPTSDRPSSIFNSRPGFFLLEIIPVLTIAAILFTVVIIALNPFRNYEKVRNLERQTETAVLADAIITYATTVNRSLLLSIPLAPALAIEICGDTVTGNCAGRFNLSPLLGGLLSEIPHDPSAPDTSAFGASTRYFLRRPSAGRVTVSAPDTEPEGAAEIAATR